MKKHLFPMKFNDENQIPLPLQKDGELLLR